MTLPTPGELAKANKGKRLTNEPAPGYDSSPITDEEFERQREELIEKCSQALGERYREGITVSLSTKGYHGKAVKGCKQRFETEGWKCKSYMEDGEWFLSFSAA